MRSNARIHSRSQAVSWVCHQVHPVRRPVSAAPLCGKNRLGDRLTVVDSFVVDSRKETIGRQMCGIAESTLAAGGERICVVRRNSEQIKAVRAISLIVANGEIRGADPGYQLPSLRVTQRTLAVYGKAAF